MAQQQLTDYPVNKIEEGTTVCLIAVDSGQLLFNTSCDEEELRNWDKAIELYPQDVLAWNNKGTVLESLVVWISTALLLEG